MTTDSILFWPVLLIAVGIIFIGTRFILSPHRAAIDFGVAAGERERRTYLWAKGTRDVVSGLMTLGLLWLGVSPAVMAVFLLIASLIPVGDLLNVYFHVHMRNKAAILIHGGTALFMWTLAVLLLRV